MSKIFEGIFKHSEEETLDEDLRKWFKEKWVRFGPDGKIRGDCARGSDSEGKPKCLPQSKAHSLGKKGRKYAASKKRREDPDPERKGAAKNVATKKKTSEAANPAQQSAIAITKKKKEGVSEDQTGVGVKKWAAQVRQEHGADTKFWNDKTHNRIIARKDNEIVGSYDRKANNGTVFSPEQDVEFNGDLDSKGRFTKDTVQKMFGKLSPDAKNIKEEKCPHCGGELVSEELMNEKQDACYHKVKSRYKVWPSAYASGALVKCRKKGAKNWGNKSESAIMRGIQNERANNDRNVWSANEPTTSKLAPGNIVHHELLGVVTVLKIQGSGLIVKDDKGKHYKVGLYSVR